MKRVSPEEALGLMEKDGYVYVDVRSVPEFEAGHPAGAFNVPLLDMSPMGMTPNPDFLRVMESSLKTNVNRPMLTEVLALIASPSLAKILDDNHMRSR